jgi:hypothetical protein
MYGGLTGFGMYEDDEFDYDEEPESLGGLLLGGARRRKKVNARMRLKNLMDAESSAAKLESRAGHKGFAKRLADDYLWNAGVYKSKKTPAWMSSKYSSIYGRPAPKRKASTAGKILNPATGRMVSRTGAIGRALLSGRR